MLALFQNYSGMFLDGFKVTILSSLIALFFSLLIGTLMAIFQLSSNKVVRGLARGYVELFRNIPLLIIAMFFYVVLPMYGFPFTGFQAGTIGLTIYTSAFIAETVRSGIQTVPKGQTEAALSSGFSSVQVMRYIVLPQAFKIVIPPLGGQFINLIKNSSILAIVAGLDLMYQGDLIASTTFITFDTYIIVGIFYLILTLPLSYLMNYLEKRLDV
ncbi:MULTISPECIES: amino acid ABC transporter permease [Tetragenococcus]|uniref:Glutamate transport membrane-spanning protein n=3 Tax=Tetragenococcus TaxID=51668 RepID=A0A091C024_9ENTE|nr:MULTISPECIES: amino acid ABC transporter permease [Tetragenococcus]GMA47231.1 glutamine ABC transporter permease [Tetragenococcus muriaticus]GMA54395.1 glutamine ABC transporter permease [Alicyclobacillus contaminans]AYW48513.1 amino acid ABC transporter permease [Tetragenococcus osmophilus]KFN91216.1 glutamate transport membrane-spanning protein [Tetragenococcus muriaticus 3MR10-3]GMA71749.1 glutamine ABC transporter permease [Tetragenococcus osmophilus]